jgi:hypothetical protein
MEHLRCLYLPVLDENGAFTNAYSCDRSENTRDKVSMIFTWR